MSNMRNSHTLSVSILTIFVLIFAAGLVMMYIQDGDEPSHVFHNAQDATTLECIERGECDPLEPTFGEAPGGGVSYPENGEPNPHYDGSEPSPSTDMGTKNDAHSEEAYTGASSKPVNPPTGR